MNYDKKQLEFSCRIEEKGKCKKIEKYVDTENSEYLDYLKLFLKQYIAM